MQRRSRPHAVLAKGRLAVDTAIALPPFPSSAPVPSLPTGLPFRHTSPPRPAPPRPPQVLECLKLNRNEITSIFPGAFVSLTMLNSLELKGNLLTVITGADFGDVPRLRQLQLQNNRLTQIDTGAFSAMKLLESMWVANRKSNLRLSRLRYGAIFFWLTLPTRIQPKKG